MQEATMPKMKTNRSAAKRFRKTGSGKVKRNKAFGAHLFTGKTRKRKRQLRQATIVVQADNKRIQRLIPYI
jgi:large subunit ribosomal protein L35